MTIEDIEKTLPSGFHDASLKKLNIDFDKREVRLEVLVDVGEPDSAEDELNEATRHGILTVSGLLFCVIEPPKVQFPREIDGEPWIVSSGAIEFAKLPTKLPEPLPKGIFAHCFFVNNWNASIIIVAKDARFDWS